jgi:hypothetical protein
MSSGRLVGVIARKVTFTIVGVNSKSSDGVAAV